MAKGINENTARESQAMFGKPLSRSYAVKELRQVRKKYPGGAGKKLANSFGPANSLRYVT